MPYETPSVLLITESGFGKLLNAAIEGTPDDAVVAQILARPGVGQLMHWSDFAVALRSVGVSAETVFLNSGGLRRAADREFGLPYSENDSQHLYNRIRHSPPETVLFASHQGFQQHAGLVTEALRDSGQTQLKIGFHATYVGRLETAVAPSFVLAATPGILRQVARYGVPAYLWYLHPPGRTWVQGSTKAHEDRAIPLSFVGNSGFWDDRYRWRAWVLGTLIDAIFPLSIFHYGPNRTRRMNQGLKRRFGAIATDFTAMRTNTEKESEQRCATEAPWFSSVRATPPDDLKHRAKVRRWRRSGLQASEPGSLTDQILNESVLTINAHGDRVLDVGNLRMFEAASMGICQICDSGSNLADLFESDSEIVTFSNVEEAREKTQFLLDNPTYSNRIGRAARQRYDSSHTPMARAAELMQLLWHGPKDSAQ